jgi:hypothetical protein
MTCCPYPVYELPAPPYEFIQNEQYDHTTKEPPANSRRTNCKIVVIKPDCEHVCRYAVYSIKRKKKG